jgi:hypothetical protein
MILKPVTFVIGFFVYDEYELEGVKSLLDKILSIFVR